MGSENKVSIHMVGFVVKMWRKNLVPVVIL